MTASTPTTQPTVPADSSAAARRAEVDRSVRGLVLFCFASAIFWLVVGSFLQVISGTQLVIPSFLDCAAFFTFGRVQPAGLTALVFGWGSLAGLGFGIWQMARASGKVVRGVTLPVCSVILWNLALVGGVLGILAGKGSGIPYLELPGPAAFAILLAFGLLVIWLLLTLRGTPGQPLYIAKAFFVVALFLFAWLYSSANTLLIWTVSPGLVTGPIEGWFENGLFGLWLTFLSLSALFYLLPVAAGRPLHSQGLATFAFWTLLFFGGWGGMRYFIGGPIPAWMVSASVVATFLLILPALAVVTNLGRTIGDAGSRLWEAPTTRYLIAGLIFYFSWVVGCAFVAIPTVSSIFHFTIYQEGLTLIAIYGFVSLTLIGAILTLLPRFGHSFNPASASLHFWLIIVGLGLFATSATIGGLLQGFALYDVEVSFLNVVDYVFPFRVLVFVGLLTVFAATLGFAALFARSVYVPAKEPAVPVSQPVPQNVEVVA